MSNIPFVGRKHELNQLNLLKDRQSSAIFCVKGRRRIGKSRLIQEFGKKFDRFIELQGLAPRENQTNQDQLDNFLAQLSRQTPFPRVKLEDWDQAFEALNSILDERSTLVLLDEISWMGKYDKNFPGKLRVLWDTVFSKRENLFIAICGSVSSWIESNILNSTHFVGRISLAITLKELELKECNKFLERGGADLSVLEKLRYLSVTGGVPRYLEEIHTKETFEKNINTLAFTQGGFLYLEMDRLFNNSFESEKQVYRNILALLSKGHKTLKEIAIELGKTRGGSLSEAMWHMEQAGFVSKDLQWSLTGAKLAQSRYRVSDNYSRFYYRAIKPKLSQINQGVLGQVSVEQLPAWSAILGLQFENLVFNNLSFIMQALEIDPASILSVGPFRQNKTTKNLGGVQIDLVVVTRFDTAYICEIKFRKSIKKEVESEVAKKIALLQRPKHLSLRPVLIYAGELDESLEYSEYFYKMVDLGRGLA